MGCQCNNKINSTIDLSQLDPISWEDAKALIGIDNCNKLNTVEKPLYELTDEDVEKLNKIIVTGDGSLFLANDGTYKPIDTTPAIKLSYQPTGAQFVAENATNLVAIRDSIADGNLPLILLSGYKDIVYVPLTPVLTNDRIALYYYSLNFDTTISAVKSVPLKIEIVLLRNSLIDIVAYSFTNPNDIDNAVMYEADDEVRLRKDLILANDANVFGTDLMGRLFNLVELSRYDIIDMGSSSKHFNINSSDRPTVQLIGETGAESHPIAFQSEVQEVEANLQNLESTVEDHYTEYGSFVTAINNTLNNIADDLNAKQEAIDANTQDIATNTQDIEQLREDFNNQEHFRGYWHTTEEIEAINNPSGGDYAYNAETGTKWIYDGTQWSDTTILVPDQTVPPSDNQPLMNGESNPGTSNEYSRGDHRHPSDTTKADVLDLNNYLKLEGNTQIDPITGDIWIKTGNKINLTDSGNSYIGNNIGTNTLEIKGNGVGGIDLTSENGAIKANGKEIANNEDVATSLSQKVDKITETASFNRIYAVSPSGVQTSIQASTSAQPNSIPIRTATGAINTGAPTEASHATTLEYVNNLISQLRSELGL